MINKGFSSFKIPAFQTCSIILNYNETNQIISYDYLRSVFIKEYQENKSYNEEDEEYCTFLTQSKIFSCINNILMKRIIDFIINIETIDHTSFRNRELSISYLLLLLLLFLYIYLNDSLFSIC